MVFKKCYTNKYVVPVRITHLQCDIPQSVNEKLSTKREKNNNIFFVSLITLALLCGFVLFSIVCLHANGIKQFFKSNDQTNLLKNDKSENKVVSCYYNLPSPSNTSQLTPSNINPHLCTHINIAFAQIRNKEIFLEDYQIKVLPDLIKLKKYNPDLKILLSVGGAGNHDGFSEMVINHASRKIFIKSIKSVLRNFSLDGIDLDWEFPVVKDYGKKVSKRERQHFSQLLREIRTEYIREKRNYILTVAVAAPQMIVDVAYDVDQINMYVDFANIMTYDFHTYTALTAFTGFNSPLYAKTEEQLYIATLNINYTVQMYKDKGLDSSKIVVGIPTYGHTFTLVNPNNHKVGSPASGFGSVGALGFVNYPDICTFVRDHNNSTVLQEDKEAKVPYLYKESEWISYDNAESVIEKAKFITTNKLRGAMIYSLNADDYDGICEHLSGSKKFPLATTVSNILNLKPN